MSYRFACFISYKRPPSRAPIPGLLPVRQGRHIFLRIADEFQRTLDEFLTLTVSSVRDIQLNPGTYYPDALSKNLCCSMCMVALVVPQYFESPWCTAEWQAMESFERARGVGQKLIIPVICTDRKEELRPRFRGRIDHDLGRISTPERQFRNTGMRDKVQSIAEIINDLHRSLPGIGEHECDAHSLGLGPDIPTPCFPEPSPFAR